MIDYYHFLLDYSRGLQILKPVSAIVYHIYTSKKSPRPAATGRGFSLAEHYNE